MRSPLPLVAVLISLVFSSASFAEERAAVNTNSIDRVGLPDYLSNFILIRSANKSQRNKLGAIYVNDKAASVGDIAQLPYPAGAIIVMEWSEPRKNASGVPEVDANGLWQKGEVVRVDVMRREPGYGEAYGESRSGEWEFASYLPDGRLLEAPEKAISCAECHQKARTRDFVFRGRFPPIDQN
jgi:hypothetical protein